MTKTTTTEDVSAKAAGLAQVIKAVAEPRKPRAEQLGAEAKLRQEAARRVEVAQAELDAARRELAATSYEENLRRVRAAAAALEQARDSADAGELVARRKLHEGLSDGERA